MSVSEFIQKGNLAEAVAAATADVKRQPLKPEPRVVLAELMCFSGNLDRADELVEGASKQNRAPVPGLILLRQLLRGEVARQQWYEEGRPPQTKSEPSPELATALQAVVEFRAGDQAAAADKVGSLAQSHDRQGTLQLTSGEELRFESLRDLNDLTASVAELVSSAGKFFWVPWTEVRRAKFEPVQTLRDVLWRPVEITFTDESTERYFMPCLYSGSARSKVDTFRLGQATDWADLGAGLISGIGLRMFLAGESTPTMFEVADIQFDGASIQIEGTESDHGEPG